MRGNVLQLQGKQQKKNNQPRIGKISHQHAVTWMEVSNLMNKEAETNEHICTFEMEKRFGKRKTEGDLDCVAACLSDHEYQRVNSRDNVLKQA